MSYHAMQSSKAFSPQKVEEKIESPQKEEQKNVNFLDLDYQPQKKEVKEPTGTQNIFDLLGEPTMPTNPQIPNPNSFETNQDLLGTSANNPVPPPSGNGITLNMNEFKT